jgi:hypothetical protein
MEQWRHLHVHIAYFWGDDSFVFDKKGKPIRLFDQSVKVVNCLLEEFFGKDYIIKLS